MPVRIRHGWLVAIAAIYLYLFPYFPRIQSANELPRVYLVKAIVEDGTFAIDRQVARYGATSDLSRWDGHLYQNKAPGSSLLVVPVYAAARLVTGERELGLAFSMWLCRIVAGVIPALLFLWLLWRFLERFTPEPEIRRLVLVAYALGSMAMTYALLYYSHQLSALCIGGAWILVIENRRPLVAGLLAGCAVLVDYQTAFAVLPIAFYVAAKAPRTIPWAIAGAVLPLAMLLEYHHACFGSVLRTGYATALVYGSDHAHGLLGMTTPRLAAIWGTMLAPDNGLLVLSPWLLVAIPGGIALWRRGERALVATSIGVVAVFLYFIWSIVFWRGGWQVGPRYVTAMLPFLLPLVAVGLAELKKTPRVLELACGAIVSAVAIYTLSAATLPYWPDSLKDPLYEVTFRLLGDGAASRSLGSACGLPRIAGIVPVLAGAAALTLWSIARAAGRRTAVYAVVVAVLVLGAFSLVPHGGHEADRAYTQTLYPAVAR